MLTNDLLKDTNIRVIKRINDNNFRLQINNKEYNMLTDFNKYCYINGDEESIVNFNINNNSVSVTVAVLVLFDSTYLSIFFFSIFKLI